MKKVLLTSAMAIALSSTAAFAHHPAADIVDPEIYAMIDENVADTPHADLTFDDMGSDMDAATDAMSARDEVDSIAEQAETGGEAGMAADVDQAMDSRPELDDVASQDAAMDTMTLLEDMDRLME